MPAPETQANPRLTELDWLRILAFGLLMLYHVGMFYVSWDWHVKSPQPVRALEEWMLCLSPWRLPLLFVVSGAATGLLLERAGVQGIMRSRSRRLLLPLLFGVAVIVPPQAYLEVAEKWGYAGSYGEFWSLYFRADQRFCRDGVCLVLPTWNHLWFVAYLWAYTMLLLAAYRLAWINPNAVRWAGLTRNARLLWLPWLWFALMRQLLWPVFPATHSLIWDWYDHALYGALFVLGLVLFGQRNDRHGAWAAAVRLRWWALAVALLAHLAVRGAAAFFDPANPMPEAMQMALRAVSALRQWAPVVALLGFARLHLRGKDGPARRMLTEAVFPIYILHQTVIVVAAHHLAGLGWPQPVEAAAVLLLTLVACITNWLAVRQVAWLRPLWGIDKRQRGQQA